MSNFVIVRVNDKLIPTFLIKYNPTENSAEKSNISLWTEIKLGLKDKLIILLPANLVFSTLINIPSKNDEIIRQSIPYTVEEELATDIELNHFAYNKHTNQDLFVSVINKNILEMLVQQLKQNDLRCDEIYSEIYSCPHQNGIITLCISDKYILVRDDKNGTAVKPEMLNNYLKLSQNKKLVVFYQSETMIEPTDNVIVKKTNLAMLQTQTICSGQGVNLLQGEFAQNQPNSKSVKPWKKLSILASILVGSWLFINLYQVWDLSNQIEILKQSQKNILSKSIPNISRTELNDPYSAMLSRLKLNQESQSLNSHKGFIQGLIFVGQTLQQHPTIEIMSLRQRDSKLEVKLQAADVTSINQFQQSLKKSAYSMRVKTGTRDSTKDGFSSIITMEQM